MTRTLDKFMQKIANKSEKEVKGVFKTLNNQPEKQAHLQEKINWMLETYPYLQEDCQVAIEVQDEVPNKPYQVLLSEKYINLYRSAAKRKIEFNLTLKDVHSLLQEKECYFTGQLFVDKDKNYHRTVDRVDHTKGYVRGNVVACTFVANQLKESLFERPTKELDANIDFIYKVANKVMEKINND